MPRNDKEKNIQLRLASLAGIFCNVPAFCKPLIYILIRIRLDGLYSLLRWLDAMWRYYFLIFPRIYPKNPWILFKVFWESLCYGQAKS